MILKMNLKMIKKNYALKVTYIDAYKILNKNI